MILDPIRVWIHRAAFRLVSVQYNNYKAFTSFFLLLILTYKIRRTNVFWFLSCSIDNDDPCLCSVINSYSMSL